MTSTDIQIGRKVRQVRNMRGISQSQLADDTGITFQQIQKYEKGVNRIAVSRLFDICRALNVSASKFIAEIENEDSLPMPELTRQETRLMGELQALDPKAKNSVIHLIKSMR